MYNARMWLVVKPTVGVPLFFAGVALTSLAVHTAVLTNTTWYPEFYNGKGRPAAGATVAAAPAASVTATPVAAGGQQYGLSSIQLNLAPK